MRNFARTAFVAMAMLGLSYTGQGASAQTNLRLAVETTPGDPLNVMLAHFRDALAESAGDEVTLEFFEGGALGDESALTELLRAGQAQVVPLGSDIVQLDDKFAVFDAPFLFPTKEAARQALDGELGDWLTKSLREKANLQVIGFGELGFRAVSNNVRPIETPEDLAGLKLRTPGSKTRILAFEMLGAAPTPMSLGDVYVALRQGALDGQENPLSVIKEFSLHEVQKYVSLTNHVYSPITLTMNGGTWDSLSPELQAKVVAAARIGAEATRELSNESDAKLIGEFEKAGVKVNTPDLVAFKKAAAPIHEKIGAIVTPDFMAQVVALTE
ncbi:TRAP transporter substrate-binding protein [Nitratireductor soli]|uniref:TRAP transporter substrate-binding protein n=1 Tax=Nitratireductor soli TaxID=1670619 RepID=UPI000A8E41E2|nr:TRAP transporter substrate-binding protein [Nitratireductor soli]